MNTVKKTSSTKQHRTAAPAPKSTACAPWRGPGHAISLSPANNGMHFFRSRAKCTSAGIAAAIFLAMVPGAGLADYTNDGSITNYTGVPETSETIINNGYVSNYLSGAGDPGGVLTPDVTSLTNESDTIINNGNVGDPGGTNGTIFGSLTTIGNSQTSYTHTSGQTVTNIGNSITNNTGAYVMEIDGAVSDINLRYDSVLSDIVFTVTNSGNTITNAGTAVRVTGFGSILRTGSNPVNGYPLAEAVESTGNSITNTGTIEYGIYGDQIKYYSSPTIGSNGDILSTTVSVGGNTIDNSGSVGISGDWGGYVYGSYIKSTNNMYGVNSTFSSSFTSGNNTVTNSNYVGTLLSGSYTDFSYFTYSTTNAAINNSITATDNVVTNSGTVGSSLDDPNIYGSYSTAFYNTNADSKVVTVSGGLTQITSTGNTVTNTGTVLDGPNGDPAIPTDNGGNVYGSYSDITIHYSYTGLNTDITTGNNTIDNSGLIEGSLVGSYANITNDTPDSVNNITSLSNTITNAGTVMEDLIGSTNAINGTPLTDGTNTITAEGNFITMTPTGTVGGSIYAGTGDDTLTMQTGPESVGGMIDGQDGWDTIVYSGGVWQADDPKVTNFENSEINATYDLTLNGPWDIGDNVAEVNGGSLTVNDSLNAGGLDVNTGVANLVPGSTTTLSGPTNVGDGGTLNLGGTLDSTLLYVAPGGTANIEPTGIATVDSSEIAGILNVDGTLNSNTLYVPTGGTANIGPTGILNADSTEIAGVLNMDGTLNSNILYVPLGGTTNINPTGIVTVDSTEVDGVLNLDGTLNSPTVLIDSTGLLNGSGVINGDLTNNGTVSPGGLNGGEPFGHLTVNGDYTGSGTLAFEVDFGTGTSDLLTVNGNFSGDGTVHLIDVTNGVGSATNDITIIETPNDSDRSDEHFVFAVEDRYDGATNLSKWAGSPYVWELLSSGSGWMLGVAQTEVEESPALLAEIPAYVGMPTYAYEVMSTQIDSLHLRLGVLRSGDANDANAANTDGHLFNGWVRTIYSGFDFKSNDSFDSSGHFGVAQLGFDRKVNLDAGNALFVGFYGGYHDGSFDTDGHSNAYNAISSASTDVNGWSAGLYGTWFNEGGTYADLVLNYTGMDANITAPGRYSTSGSMLASSLEVGHAFAVAPKWVIEPQAQFKLTRVNWDDFNDGKNQVEFDNHTYVTGRAGVRAEYTAVKEPGKTIKPWVYVGVQHEFTDTPQVTYVLPFNTQDQGTTMNAQVGVSMHFNDKLQVYCDAGYTSDFSDEHDYRVAAGLRLRW